MLDADDILVEALLDDVLDETIFADSIDEALVLLHADGPDGRAELIEAELAKVEREHARLVSAIAAGDLKSGVVDVLRALAPA